MGNKNLNKGRRGEMINWTTDKGTMIVEAAIAKRAVKKAKKLGFDYKYKDAIMDIDACHSNGCPLKLGELFAADDANFAHDVFGIRRYIDRTTGELTGCFDPRYSVKLNT